MDHPLSLLPTASPASLMGSMRDYRDPQGPALLERTAPFLLWQDHRRKRLLWSFSRSVDAAPTETCHARYDHGLLIKGVNLASQDYLGLSSHPAIKRAARKAIRHYGVHSAGSPALMGNTAHSLALEKRLCDFLCMDHCVLFPTGWAAGFGVIRGLVRMDDHVVLDQQAHACLREGAYAATRNVHVATHLDNGSVRDILANIRRKDARSAILVVTESLFSMDADVPDLRGLQALCREHEATLLVDVAHDLGAMGDEGKGALGTQGLLGHVDLVMGSFSKTFATNGGFVLTRRRSVKEYLKYFAPSHTFSNGLAPMQAAVALRALEIVRSREGQHLRDTLMARVAQLRDGLTERGFTCIGTPSPIVPALLGDEGLARLTTRALAAHGLIANLVEYPGVAVGSARLRLQVMATHMPTQINTSIDAIARAYTDALWEKQQLGKPDGGYADRNVLPPL